MVQSLPAKESLEHTANELADPPLDANGLPTDLDDLVLIRATKLLGYDFRIGKYPVTNHQFRRFVEDGGYRDDRWWQDRNGRRYRDQEQWRQPRYWDDDRFNRPAQPVVGISWYEANAYCIWLLEQWRREGTISENEQVRLPTQAEWMAAARGGQQAPVNEAEDYPWHGPFDPTRANTEESAIGRTTPVHAYPSGRTAAGVWDMSGNVWEWTHDLSSAGVARLKGGSWYHDASRATAAAAAVSRYLRGYWGGSSGFRVVVVPISR